VASPASSTPSGRRSRPGSPRARLFVAIDLPDDARMQLVDWRADAFAGRDDVRLVDPAALHVTLVFLGWMAEKQIPRVAEVVRGSIPDGGPPVLSARGVKPVPPRRPRLFALDLDDVEGRAVRLQAAVSDALAREKLYQPEKRPFWPHITLARVKRRAVAAPLDAPPAPGGPWAGAAVTLYRSTLLPQGARYDPLERIPLG
jgi:RNA 2',3'-cyclic 3'-phosphodiesterase